LNDLSGDGFDMSKIDKKKALAAVLARLEEDLERQERAAGAAREGATGDEVKSESKYDTRSTEASYLARGHAMQYEALFDAIGLVKNYELPDYSTGKPIGGGALVEVKMSRFAAWYFILPAGGGIELEMGDHEVSVVTPSSPAGKSLMGKVSGDSVSIGLSKVKGLIRTVM
jgi:hypothetical protein